ncbi:MAG: PAS domain S-box protein [Pirellulaceae bacterium]
MTTTLEDSVPLIVGVGASAGGLEAFQELLRSLGDTDDLSIVFVQHLENDGGDLLIELLSKSTTMEVASITGRKKLQPGTLYVCPPWKLLELTNGSLRIAKRDNNERPEAPIDHFLQSLAEHQGERGVGVILSGTGSDGTLGLKAISDAGGMTFAQSAESAKYDSMPRSAATTGVADHVLSANAIAVELKKYASYLKSLDNESVESSSVKQIHEAIPEISKRLMELTNHNFQHYKQNTLARRIRRRMQVLKISSVESYVQHLNDDVAEPQALFRELLISVTEFFRDPEAFELLADTVIPKLFVGRKPEDAVRIWVPGCATGEEAYSIAMLCREQMSQMESPPEVQIFATDIDDRALKICRQGAYPIGIEDDVSPERLKRFFIKRSKKFQVTQEIREMVLFSAHNLISDPPFSRLDFISCRNLMIYLGPHLQKKLIPLFHYALRPSGFLLLGPSENISSHGELFRVVDAKHRLSQRKGTGANPSGEISVEEGGKNAGQSNAAPTTASQSTDDLLQVMQRIVLDEFAPKSVIVEEDGKILCASADMHKYLTVRTGNFQNNIIKMARSGLRVGLRATLQEAKAKRRRIVHDDLSIRVAGKLQRVMLTVQPMPRVGEEAELFLVVFHDAGLPLVHGEKAVTLSGDDDSTFIRADNDADAIIAHLERELSSTRHDLEKSLQDYETANEELKSSNEELISLNEEMQSANEELETSKEEIQSAVTALERTNSDLENLLRSTQIATIFLDDDLRIRSFTPAATAIYGFIPTDIGRPLTQLMPLADEIPPLPDPNTVDGSVEIKHTFQTRDGRWFVRRTLPYRSHQGARNGIVVTFHDVTAEQLAQERIKSSENQLRSLISSTAEGIYGIDHDGNCTFANEACVKLLGYQTADDLLGQHMHSLVHHSHADGSLYPLEQCKIYKAYRERRRIHSDTEVYWRNDGSSFDVEYWSYPQIHDDQVVGCVVTFLDITERKKLAREIADRESHLRRVIDSTLNFVGELDSDGVLREANATALQAGGLKREDVIGKPFWECYWWSYDEQVVRELRAAIATALTGTVVRYDVEIRTVGDSRLTIDFMLAPVSDSDGRVTHLIPSGVDISERKFAELEVQHRVAQLNLALESGQMGIWEWDIALDHVTWSSRLYEMFGYTEETFLPTKAGFLDVVHPEDQPNIERLIDSAFSQSCGNHEVEFRVIRGDNGETVWTHCRGNIFRRSDNGAPLSILSVAIDITDRKERELSLAFLADLHSKLAALTTADAIIAEASHRVAEFMQLSHFLVIEMDKNAERANVISDYCTDESMSLVGIYDMSDFATEQERQQLAAGQPMIVNDTAAETRSPDYIKSFSELHIGAILNAPSSRDTTLEFMISITRRNPHVWREDEIDLIRQLSNILRLKLERAYAETALRDSEERFRDLADNISQLAWMADAGGSIFWYNQRWFDYTGTTLEEMKDWGWKSVQHPDHLDRVVRSWTQSLDSGEVWEDTFPLRSGEGKYRWYLSRAQPIRNASGEIQRWFGTNTDITGAKQASEELQASQERLRLGIKVADFALAEIDYDTNLLTLSPEAAKLYGLEDVQTQVTRDRIHQTFHPEDRQMLQRHIDECLSANTGGEMAVDHRIVLQSGEVRWLSIRKRVFFDCSQERPRPTNAILAARDITEQKQWEIELADRESHLRRVINNQLGLVGIISKDGILLEVDDRSLAIAQTQREDVVGKHFANAPWWSYDAKVAKDMRDAVDRAIAGEIVRYDVSLFAHGDEGVLIDFMIAPVKNAAGEVEFLIPSGVDIRERAAYERSLKETSIRMEMAMRAGGMAAWEWTPEKSVWTDQLYDLLGIDPKQEPSSELFFSLVHPDDIESLKSHWQIAVDGADTYDAEFRIIRADGQVRWMHGMGEVVRNRSGQVIKMYGINWDATSEHEQAAALRESEKRAQAANRAKSEFLANMSHEIRTPMTAILGYIDLIAENLQDGQAVQYVRTIRRNGGFLLDIINDILDLSKIEAGKFEINQQRFSPQGLVEDVLSIMEIRATEKSIVLEVEYRSSIPTQIESDPKRLRQILINLVGNAIKFTPEGSVRLVVSYSEITRKLQFDVIDSGVGISDQQRQRLFQPFSQGDGNVNREFGGTGLGLAISKRLTEMLDGEISVQSELGKGSTFSVSIATGNFEPVELVDPAIQNHAHRTETQATDIQLDGHILVVDDRRDIRYLSKRFLSAAGAKVDEAEDGEVTIAAVVRAMKQSRSYDLILLDMQMPKLDGYTTAKALRELGFAGPIIALTADAMQGDMSRCIECGCNDYLSKPIDKTQLLNLVKQHLSK